MKLLFLHGHHSTPGGVKPTFLAQHGHKVLNPALPDDDFDEAVKIAKDEVDRHRPDVVVGIQSGRGGGGRTRTILEHFTGEFGMSDDSRVGWVNKGIGRPSIEGNLEISTSQSGIFIGGDPDGLRSLARLLTWLADVDQESLSAQPDGERCHVHLHARDAEGFNSLTPFSTETELCRLDAKGTGGFPDKYLREKGKRKGGG